MYDAPRPEPKFFFGCRNGLIIMSIFYSLVVAAWWWL
jgi:hypothetical protein